MRSRYFLACPSSPARRHPPAPPTPTGCSSGCPGTPCLSVAVADEIRFACLCATLVVLRQSLTVAPRNLNGYIHKSKGLEYHTVIFVGLDDRAWWSFSTDPVEGTAGFFVAFSRAKQRAVFTYCVSRGLRNKIAPLYKLLQSAGVESRDLG